jgi:hypothetical protein
MKINLGLTLTIIFVVLKLTNVISWSWVWVLSPLWISAIIVGLALLFATVVLALVNRAVLSGRIRVVRKDQ